MSVRDEIRTLVRERQSSVSMIEMAELSARISEKVLAMPEYACAKRIMCYSGKTGEVSTAALIKEILRSGRELYLPVVVSETQMHAVRLTRPEAVKMGAFGILEPDGGEEAAPDSLDVILAPGVAFDARGARLGHGKGYFDRFLPGCRGLIVGLAYEMQMVDEIPEEPHDIFMDRIITEKTVYDCAAVRRDNR